MHSERKSAKRQNGFTLIELLVVLSIISILLTLVLPHYFGSIEKSREAVLHQDLVVMRDAIDKYYGDNGKYPSALEDLIQRKYLRGLPVDPITQSTKTWLIIAPDNSDQGEVYDIRSGAKGTSSNGTPYSEW